MLDGGAYWRNQTNTIESLMCGDDAAFLSNYFDHLLPLYIKRGKVHVRMYVSSSVTLGVASSVANDATMRMASQ